MSRRLLIVLSVSAVVAVVALTLATRRPTTAGDALAAGTVREVSGTMPVLPSSTLDGRRLSAAEYGGRAVVVNFWATTCGPCRREQPLLADVSRTSGRDAFFIGVDYQDDDAAARRWLERYDVPYVNVADPDGSIASRFGVTVGLPTTVIVDARGQLRFQVLGEIDRETLEDLLDRVGAAPAA
jgi:thiol-disulfide isomerase/thioredoxin